MFSTYFNALSLFVVAAIFGLTFIFYLKKKERFAKAANVTFILVFTITMFYMAFTLSDLMNLKRTGGRMSFILLSNAYAGIIKLVEMVVSGIKKSR
jgi:hypothetical protein